MKKKPSEKPRSIRVHVLLNEEEEAILLLLASAEGVGLSTILRQAAMREAKRRKIGDALLLISGSYQK